MLSLTFYNYGVFFSLTFPAVQITLTTCSSIIVAYSFYRSFAINSRITYGKTCNIIISDSGAATDFEYIIVSTFLSTLPSEETITSTAEAEYEESADS